MTKPVTRQSGPVKPSGPRFKFASETISELRKVVWLRRREALYLTALVLVVAGVVGVLLGALDFGFTHLVDRLFLGR